MDLQLVLEAHALLVALKTHGQNVMRRVRLEFQRELVAIASVCTNSDRSGHRPEGRRARIERKGAQPGYDEVAHQALSVTADDALVLLYIKPICAARHTRGAGVLGR